MAGVLEDFWGGRVLVNVHSIITGWAGGVNLGPPPIRLERAGGVNLDPPPHKQQRYICHQMSGELFLLVGDVGDLGKILQEQVPES